MKTPLLVVAVLFLVIEIICFILAPAPIEGESHEAVLAGMEYVPYIMTAMTVAFISFFLVLFIGILAILQNKIKALGPVLVLLGIAFILPIVLYYSLF